MQQESIHKFPRVSVITPAHNSEKTIKKTLLSAMKQDYPNIECIVVNDCSQDATQSIVESLQEEHPEIVLINNPRNLGSAKARNIGMKNATGEIFAVLDHDDLWIRKDKISKQVHFLQEHPNVGILGTNYILVKNGRYTSKNLYLTDDEIRAHTLRGTQILHSSMVYPRKVYETIGEYNKNFKYSEDREYQLRAGKFFAFANLPDHLVAYYHHPDNASHNHRKRQGMDSFLLSLKYCRDYPNALPCIISKIINGGYMFVVRSLDVLTTGMKG